MLFFSPNMIPLCLSHMRIFVFYTGCGVSVFLFLCSGGFWTGNLCHSMSIKKIHLKWFIYSISYEGAFKFFFSVFISKPIPCMQLVLLKIQ